MRFMLLLLIAGVLAPAVLLAQAAAPGPRPAQPDVALLVIDIQSFYFEGGLVPLTGSVEAAAQARRVLEKFREKHLPVIHVRHLAKDAPVGGDGEPKDPQYRIRPEVAPAQGEKVITKHYANSFRNTELLDYLRRNGITKLVITGMQTHMCVEAAARAAADLGFDVTVVSDACATRPLEFGGRTVPADQVHAAALAALKGTYAKVVSVDELLEGM